MTMLRGQMFMVQAQQNQLAATNMLMMNIQMNWLLLNEEAECGINPNSEDLDAEEDDGSISALIRSTTTGLPASLQ
jgi:hypothetical protein